MKKIFSMFFVIVLIFSLSACSEKEEPVTIVEEKTPTPPFTDISGIVAENIKITNPYPEDLLLDRYQNDLYYFNYKIGFYTTDPNGVGKNRIKVFNGKDYIFFNTTNRINRTNKSGKEFKNLITRTTEEEIKLLFMSNDWLYYQVKNIIDGSFSYHRVNLTGTSEEIDEKHIERISLKDKTFASYFYPKQLDANTLSYNQTYRSRNNNFSITFPVEWDGNYIIIDEKDSFIVKYKPRLVENLNYEFFRIIKAENENNWLPPIDNTNRYYFNRNGKYIIGRYQDYISENDLEYKLIQQMEEFIPEIIYSLQ